MRRMKRWTTLPRWGFHWRARLLLSLAILPPFCVSGAGTEDAARSAPVAAPAAALAGQEAGESISRTLSIRDAVILGLVEGITEYLPVSSTGHLILTNKWLGLDSEAVILDSDGLPVQNARGEPLTLKRAADAYAIVIQGGAILAVILLYWSRIWSLFLGLIGRSLGGRILLRNLILAFLPAAAVGLVLKNWIEDHLFRPGPVVAALGFGAILMLAVERWRKGTRGGLSALEEERSTPDIHQLGVRQALMVGCFQCLALWPGMSRSMVTLVGGYLAGLAPRRAAEFSFLLGLMTLTAASAYTFLRSGREMMTVLDWQPVLVGIAVACASALLAVQWLVRYLVRHGLTVFAWYRLALAALVAATWV